MWPMPTDADVPEDSDTPAPWLHPDAWLWLTPADGWWRENWTPNGPSPTTRSGIGCPPRSCPTSWLVPDDVPADWPGTEESPLD